MTATIETPTATSNKIELSGVELARIVGNALVFADSGRYALDALASVRLALSDGVLTAVATDRYTLGLDTLTAEGGRAEGSFGFKLRAADAKQLITLVKGERFGVVLTHEDEKLTVRTFDASQSFRPGTGAYPDIDRLMVTPDNPDPLAEIAFNPAQLAKFAKVQGGSKGLPLRLAFDGDKATHVAIGDTFRGLIMRVRIDLS